MGNVLIYEASFLNYLFSHVDLLATFAEIVGEELAEPADSLNQLETLTGTLCVA